MIMIFVTPGNVITKLKMGNKMSFEDRMRESKRKINRSVREIDRERTRL